MSYILFHICRSISGFLRKCFLLSVFPFEKYSMFQVKFGLISDRDQEDEEEDEEECYIIEDDEDLLMASFSR